MAACSRARLKVDNSGFPLVPGHIRAKGEIRALFTRSGARTAIARVHETGGLRLRFPRVPQGCEAVVLNTGGGLAGGDLQTLRFEAGPAAEVTLTTQAAEKVYRAQHDAARVDVALSLSAAAQLEWLPQETILFDQSALHRTLRVDMAADARLTMVEAIIFGRLAMGEAAISTRLRDSWRVRRDGVLVFAEELALDTGSRPSRSQATAIVAVHPLDRPALGGGARAVATLLHVAPDAESALGAVRAALAPGHCQAGASAWNNMLLVRAVSPSPQRLRAVIVTVLRALRGRDVPRVWQG